jgi:hypothetical protein
MHYHIYVFLVFLNILVLGNVCSCTVVSSQDVQLDYRPGACNSETQWLYKAAVAP